MPEFGTPFSGLASDRKLTALDYDTVAKRAAGELLTGTVRRIMRAASGAQKGESVSHRLVIESLRDLQAKCTCGRWNMSAPTSDRDTEDEIRVRAEDQFQQHLRGLRRGGRIARRGRSGLLPPRRAASKGAPTAKELLSRAEEAIENDEHFIYDVAADTGQMVDNVRHMKWFLRAVANWLIEDEDKWSHLPLFD
jgi:hypothetical protein